LSVRNTAELLDPAGCQNIFDRFWRGDHARASGHHAGLGLAIVRSVAQLLHYRVDAFLEDGQLTITLEGKTAEATQPKSS
jgi:signal transduction histidine kinase